MATGQEWENHFRQLSTSVIKKQIKLMSYFYDNVDSKIAAEFQIAYLAGVISIAKRVLSAKENFKQNRQTKYISRKKKDWGF